MGNTLGKLTGLTQFLSGKYDETQRRTNAKVANHVSVKNPKKKQAQYCIL